MLSIATLIAAAACADAANYDVLISGGTVYDGSGAAPFVGDVAINGDRVVAVGDLSAATAESVVDATGLAVSPGFVNMLSWATESLIVDGRSQGDLRQGVTLEVFGEGNSLGPMNAAMKEEWLETFVDYVGSEQRAAELLGGAVEVPWTTLGDYLEFLETKGISTNVASFLGATTTRIHELGYADRAPNEEELERMRQLVHTAMREGAMGIGSSLIYAPAFYAKTDELVAISSVAAEYGGMYISHMRSEGNRLLEAVEELIGISRAAGLPAEIYHLKQGGEQNWDKLDQVIEMVEAARAEGLRITADMYNYIAGSTGLDAAMPPWVQEGGYDAWAERLRDPSVRARVAAEMVAQQDDWENLMQGATPEGSLLVEFRNPNLRGYIGRTLADVAAERGTSAQKTAMDLVVEDGSRVQVVYFLMSEDNVKRQIALPWVSFDSDAGSMAPEPPFTDGSTHPRAYGNFARLLGKYVREEGVIPLEEAIRKLTSLPTTNLSISDRGMLAEGYYADVVVFDPATIIDHATFEDPHQYSTGVVHVFVNGGQVLRDGEHTGATPGRVVRGPGWTGGGP
ncbi:MAG: D-aminoacylase [Gemmatimonadetes bacterium]|nr:D-aminoacylase [Gemmatimonadota bacterium]MEE2845317.1 D-aminoacylase [Gemmatimonadota bacterium]